MNKLVNVLFLLLLIITIIPNNSKAVMPNCGDVDGSDAIDISDALYLINYFFNSGSVPQDNSGGDLNCDAKTNIADAVYLINFIFLGGPMPCFDCDLTNPPGLLWVANQTDSTIFLYDTKTLIRLDSIEAMVALPHYLEFSPDGNNYYTITRELNGRIAKYNAVSNSFMSATNVGGTVLPTAIAITTDSKFGYVCDFTLGSDRGLIYKFDLDSLTIVDQMQTGAATHDLKITHNGEIVIAASRNTDDVTFVYTDEDSVFIFSLNPADPSIPGQPKYGPYGVIIDHNDSLAYIACLVGDQIKVVDIATRQVIDSVVVPIIAECGYAPSGPTLMVVSPDNKYLFVTTQCANNVTIIDLDTRTIIKDLPIGAGRSFGITQSADGSRVYATAVNFQNEQGKVYIINSSTLELIDSLNVGVNPYGIIWQAKY